MMYLGTLAGLALPGQPDTPLLSRCHYRSQPDTVRTLPVSLQEISGLAFHRGVLLAHDDELGRIYTINPLTGAVTIFATLRGPIHDDFEGIAVLGDTVWLMTSSGKLYGVKATASRDPVAYALYHTGLGKRCELEGLAADAATRRAAASVQDAAEERAGHADLSLERGKESARDPDGGERDGESHEEGWCTDASVRARSKSCQAAITCWCCHPVPPALLELDGAGVPQGYIRLPSSHAQPEGLAIGSNGDIFISDEGVNRTGTLSVYRCNP